MISQCQETVNLKVTKQRPNTVTNKSIFLQVVIIHSA